jgi:hypothetical protein
MSDDQHSRRLTEKIRAQIDAFESDPRAKAQAELDRWWQSRLDRAALSARGPGDYNPIRRFELEQDDVQERYDDRRRR